MVGLVFDPSKKSPSIHLNTDGTVASITSNHIGTVLGSHPLSQTMYKFKFHVKRLGTDELLLGVATRHVLGKIGLNEDSWALSHTGLLYHGESTVETSL